MEEPIHEPHDRLKAAGERVEAQNTPFGHPMTKRARQVTVPIHAAPAPETATPLPIPVEGSAQLEMTIAVSAGDACDGETAA
ncbi:MAG: hypothetical protein H7338_12835 [Candidatus Sericytochromatia bacterium]|nr:hypothetical protein [Candidatus Sericytochromatia bacterium]